MVTKHSRKYSRLPARLGVLCWSLTGVAACVTTTTTTRNGIPYTAPPPPPHSKSKPAAAAPAAAPSNADTATARQQVIAAEKGFAQTMADRNFKSFVTFLSPDAVFFTGSKVLHGPAEVASRWEQYFVGREAPFSWTPDEVEVLPSGNLALSTGPVIQNQKIVGRFNSVWRLEGPNTWRVVFDKGESVCGIGPGS
jgi:ketosteroid isomerase-like protein